LAGQQSGTVGSRGSGGRALLKSRVFAGERIMRSAMELAVIS